MSKMKEYTDNWYTDIEQCMTNLDLKPRFGGYDTGSVNTGLRKLIAVYNDNIAAIIGEYASLEQEKQELQEKLKQALRHSGSGSQNNNAEVKSLSATISQLRSQLDASQKKCDGMIAQLKEQTSKVNQAGSALDAANKENNLLRQKIEELKKNQESRATVLSDDSAVVARLTQERDSAKSQAESIKHLFDDAAEEIKNLQKQLLELQTSASKQEFASMSSVVQEIKRLRQERDDAKAEIQEVNGRLQLAEVENAMLQDQLHDQANAAAASSTDADQKHAALEAERDAAIQERDNISRVCAGLREELQNMKLEAEDLNDIYREAKRKRRQIIQDAEDAAAKLMQETYEKLDQETKEREQMNARTAEESMLAAQEMTRKAQTESDEILAKAKAEADSLLTEAHETRNLSMEEAGTLLNDARAEAERMQSEANAKLSAAREKAEKLASELKNRATYEADVLVSKANEQAKEIEAKAQELLEQAHHEAEALVEAAKAEHSARMSDIEDEVRATKENANRELAEIEDKIQDKRNQHTMLLRQIGDVRLSMLDSLQADISRLNQLTHEISRNNVLTSADMNLFAETGYIRPKTISSAPVQEDEKKDDEQ